MNIWTFLLAIILELEWLCHSTGIRSALINTKKPTLFSWQIVLGYKYQFHVEERISWWNRDALIKLSRKYLYNIKYLCYHISQISQLMNKTTEVKVSHTVRKNTQIREYIRKYHMNTRLRNKPPLDSQFHVHFQFFFFRENNILYFCGYKLT